MGLGSADNVSQTVHRIPMSLPCFRYSLKAAAFALILRLVAEGFVPAAERWEQWQLVFAVLAAVTMLVGNLVALAQKNLKRLLAYSSIGHAGFILAGITALSTNSDLASNGVMFYLVGYSITNLVVFAALISFFNMTGKEMIADLGGLADSQPFLAACLGMGLFSLAGLPIFAGFTMKFYLFTAVATEGFLWLAGLAIFSSLIGLYYYLQVLRHVYIEPTPTGDGGGDLVTEHPALTRRPSLSLITVLGTGAAAMIWLGVYPRPLIEVIEAASRALMS